MSVARPSLDPSKSLGESRFMFYDGMLSGKFDVTIFTFRGVRISKVHEVHVCVSKFYVMNFAVVAAFNPNKLSDRL